MHSVWRPDTVLTGDEWDMFLAVPPLLGRPVRAGRDPRQRGRHDRARAYGALLPGRADRRRRARPGRDRGRAALLRARRQPAAHVVHRRRAAVPAPDRRALRPDHRRRLPASRTCRSTSRRASSSGSCASGSPRAGSSRSTSRPCPATTGWPRGSRGTLATEFPQVVTWQALRFNQLVIGLDRPLARRCSRAGSRTRPRTARAAARPARAGLRPAPPVEPTRGRTTARRSSGSPTG